MDRQFARVVKGVDLRATAGNCARVRTPQLTSLLAFEHAQNLLVVGVPAGSFAVPSLFTNEIVFFGFDKYLFWGACQKQRRHYCVWLLTCLGHTLQLRGPNFLSLDIAFVHVDGYVFRHPNRKGAVSAPVLRGPPASLF